MKKLLLGTLLLGVVIVVPVPTMARVNISIGIGIPLPPPVVFPAPPTVVVMPDTNYVYVVPDMDADIFFWYGWWWRLWDGRWYRSHYYDRGWVYYDRVPSFYYDVDPRWREHYRSHNWYGHRWNYERIPTRQLQKNWKSWQNNRHWEWRQTWGIQNYKPRTYQQRQELRHQRQEQYQQRHEVQQRQQRIQERQRQPKVRNPHGQQPRLQHSQPRGQQYQKGSRHQKYQGKPSRGYAGQRR